MWDKQSTMCIKHFKHHPQWRYDEMCNKLSQSDDYLCVKHFMSSILKGRHGLASFSLVLTQQWLPSIAGRQSFFRHCQSALDRSLLAVPVCLLEGPCGLSVALNQKHLSVYSDNRSWWFCVDFCFHCAFNYILMHFHNACKHTKNT